MNEYHLTDLIRRFGNHDVFVPESKEKILLRLCTSRVEDTCEEATGKWFGCMCGHVYIKAELSLSLLLDSRLNFLSRSKHETKALPRKYPTSQSIVFSHWCFGLQFFYNYKLSHTQSGNTDEYFFLLSSTSWLSGVSSEQSVRRQKKVSIMWKFSLCHISKSCCRSNISNTSTRHRTL